jgi:hypothetical protein
MDPQDPWILFFPHWKISIDNLNKGGYLYLQVTVGPHRLEASIAQKNSSNQPE